MLVDPEAKECIWCDAPFPRYLLVEAPERTAIEDVVIPWMLLLIPLWLPFLYMLLEALERSVLGTGFVGRMLIPTALIAPFIGSYPVLVSRRIPGLAKPFALVGYLAVAGVTELIVGLLSAVVIAPWFR